MSIQPRVKRPIKAAGVLLYRKTAGGSLKWLMLRDRSTRHWDPVKGRREPGETAVEAARRECREETGIRVTVDSSHRRIRVRYDNWSGLPKQVDYYLIESPTKQVHLSGEHIEARWMLLDDVLRRSSRPEIKRLFRQAVEQLPKRHRRLV